jgi:uncharacterized glyoxalase superfamily protein PhnB
MALDIRGMTPLLEVFDMPTALNFYCGVLEFEVALCDDEKKAPNYDWVLLRREGADLMLNTMYEEGQRPPEQDARRSAAHHDVTFYFAAPDVDAVYEHLNKLGLVKKPPNIAYYGMKQLYLTDPDGYNLCFQWRAEKTVSGS